MPIFRLALIYENNEMKFHPPLNDLLELTKYIIKKISLCLQNVSRLLFYSGTLLSQLSTVTPLFDHFLFQVKLVCNAAGGPKTKCEASHKWSLMIHFSDLNSSVCIILRNCCYVLAHRWDKLSNMRLTHLRRAYSKRDTSFLVFFPNFFGRYRQGDH